MHRPICSHLEHAMLREKDNDVMTVTALAQAASEFSDVRHFRAVTVLTVHQPSARMHLHMYILPPVQYIASQAMHVHISISKQACTSSGGASGTYRHIQSTIVRHEK